MKGVTYSLESLLGPRTPAEDLPFPRWVLARGAGCQQVEGWGGREACGQGTLCPATQPPWSQRPAAQWL